MINTNGAELVMTPLILGLEVNDNAINQIELDTFELQPVQSRSYSRKDKQDRARKNGYQYRPRLGSTWHIVQNQLEEIIEEDNLGDYDFISSEYSDDFDSDLSEIYEVDESVFGVSSRVDTEKISFNNLPTKQPEEPLLPEWKVNNPKAQLFTKLKKILTNDQINSNSAKIQAFKQTISNYIFEFEKYYFEQSFQRISNESEDDLKKFEQIIFEGLAQTFRKKIGGLPFEKRRIKLLRYLDKKKRRVWQKKVNYDCRKKVADCRLRVKGKFVTFEQACEQLGIPENQAEKPENVKDLLRRFTKAD